MAGAYDGDLTAGCGGGCGGWFGGWCYGCHVYMNAIDNDFTLTSIPLLLILIIILSWAALRAEDWRWQIDGRSDGKFLRREAGREPPGGGAGRR